MATAKLKIQDGKIEAYRDAYFESLSNDRLFYKGNNGWEVTIIPAKNGKKGKIVCHVEKIYSTGKAVCHKNFPLQDGTLGLAGGKVTKRYAYFRTAKFQNFLQEYGITAVSHADPNGEYEGDVFANHGKGESTFDLWTDGSVEKEVTFENAIASKKLKVVEATWTLVSTSQWTGDHKNHSNILYTLVKDVTTLEDSLKEHLDYL